MIKIKIKFLVFAVVFCFFGVSCNAGSNESILKKDSAKAAVKTSADKIAVQKKTEVIKAQAPAIIVYYFHGDARCYSCIRIEKYTREAIEKGFNDNKNGLRVEFKPVNIDEKSNRHFIKDYKLSSKSVIVQKISDKDDKAADWKNLDKIWLLTGNKKKFIQYIREETEKLSVIK